MAEQAEIGNLIDSMVVSLRLLGQEAIKVEDPKLLVRALRAVGAIAAGITDYREVLNYSSVPDSQLVADPLVDSSDAEYSDATTEQVMTDETNRTLNRLDALASHDQRAKAPCLSDLPGIAETVIASKDVVPARKENSTQLIINDEAGVKLLALGPSGPQGLSGNAELKSAKWVVTYSPREQVVLKYLEDNAGRLISRTELLAQITALPEDRPAILNHLREKVEQDSSMAARMMITRGRREPSWSLAPITRAEAPASLPRSSKRITRSMRSTSPGTATAPLDEKDPDTKAESCVVVLDGIERSLLEYLLEHPSVKIRPIELSRSPIVTSHGFRHKTSVQRVNNFIKKMQTHPDYASRFFIEGNTNSRHMWLDQQEVTPEVKTPTRLDSIGPRIDTLDTDASSDRFSVTDWGMQVTEAGVFIRGNALRLSSLSKSIVGILVQNRLGVSKNRLARMLNDPTLVEKPEIIVSVADITKAIQALRVEIARFQMNECIEVSMVPLGNQRLEMLKLRGVLDNIAVINRSYGQ